jgi:hypothetical protein
VGSKEPVTCVGEKSMIFMLWFRCWNYCTSGRRNSCAFLFGTGPIDTVCGPEDTVCERIEIDYAHCDGLPTMFK